MFMFEPLNTGAEIGMNFFEDFNCPVEINQRHIQQYYALSYKEYKKLLKSLELARSKRVSDVREIHEWKRKYKELFQRELILNKELSLAKEQHYNVEKEFNNLKTDAEIFQTQYNELQKKYDDLLKQVQSASTVHSCVTSSSGIVDRNHHTTNHHSELYYSYRPSMTVAPPQPECQDDDYNNIVDNLKKLVIRHKTYTKKKQREQKQKAKSYVNL